MTFTIIFLASGLVLVTLIVSKKIEEKTRRPFFVSKIISKGDIHARKLYHALVHFYSDGKDRTFFLIQKQVPMRSRNWFNKTSSYLKEKRDQYTDNMRDSRLLKKSDGISEFFKSISDVEKGNGEIHDSFEDAHLNDTQGGQDFQNEEKRVK